MNRHIEYLKILKRDRDAAPADSYARTCRGIELRAVVDAFESMGHISYDEARELTKDML